MDKEFLCRLCIVYVIHVQVCNWILWKEGLAIQFQIRDAEQIIEMDAFMGTVTTYCNPS